MTWRKQVEIDRRNENFMRAAAMMRPSVIHIASAGQDDVPDVDADITIGINKLGHSKHTDLAACYDSDMAERVGSPKPVWWARHFNRDWCPKVTEAGCKSTLPLCLERALALWPSALFVITGMRMEGDGNGGNDVRGRWSLERAALAEIWEQDRICWIR